MEYNFEDFIPVYPKQDDPDIQYKIGVKKEFLEDAGIASEPPPSLGGLYKHQRAFLKYMKQMDRMLNIQSVGTGKTCALVALAEYYKKNKSTIRHVYVLEKGESTIQEFKNQVARKCTAGDYLTPDVRNPTIEERYRQAALTREIHTWYSIKTYGNFIKEVQQNGMTQEDIDRKYSGCIFFIDEAHNLTEDRKLRGQNTPEEPDEVEDSEFEKEKKKNYKVFWDFFHKVKRSKIILATATPMLNTVNELVKLMNLLLPENMQMPSAGPGNKWDYNKVTLSQLEPFFRGRVSYVRALETGVNIDYQGDFMDEEYHLEFADEDQEVPFVFATPENPSPEQPKTKTTKQTFKSQTRVYSLPMSSFQNAAYDVAIKSKASFDSEKRKASCLVFPDGSFGGDFNKRNNIEFTKFIKPTGKNSYELTKEFTSHLRKDVLEDLATFSCKYYFIIRNEIEAYLRRQAGEIVGNAFCYSEIVTSGGAIMLGKLMEYYGFKKYSQTSSVFITNKEGKKVISSSFGKELRYGFLTSEMPDSERNSLLELFNSPENYNGEYCQTMIGTLSARDGINVFNVLRGYLVASGWHQSGNIQALARFIRATSHDVINQKLAEMYRAKSKPIEKAQIKVYRLVASPKNPKNAIDLDLYTTSERKDISISRMMRFLKQCAFDCTIHYMRNHRSGDIDGSPECDYMKCNYACYPSNITNIIDEDETDFSTYDILYSDEIVNECKEEIIKEVTVRNTINIEELYTLPVMRLYKVKYINMAINKIMEERTTVRNRFGFMMFVNTNGNSLFTQSELPNYSNNNHNLVNLSMYKDMMFGYIKNSLNSLISKLSVNDEDIKNKLLKMKNISTTNFEQFDEMFSLLTFEEQLKFLELAIRFEEVENPTESFETDLSAAIRRKFRNYFFKMREPTTDILNIKNYLESSGDRRGRVRKETKCPKVNITMIGENDFGEVVYFHDYMVSKSDNAAFSTNSQFFNSGENIRIFKPSEGEWRDVYPFECQAYKNLINKQREKKLSQFSKFTEFGTILNDKKFRIINNESLNLDNPDKRTITKGSVCTSYEYKIDIIDILLRSNYMPEEVQEIKLPPELKTRQDYENYLLYQVQAVKVLERLEKYSVKDLQFISKYFLSDKSKDKICNYVKELFFKEGRIYVA